jgi:hypothetical protein
VNKNPDPSLRECNSIQPPLYFSATPAPIAAKPATILAMDLAVIGIRLLEIMFFVGLVGSSVVVLISFVEDAKELFGED